MDSATKSAIKRLFVNPITGLVVLIAVYFGEAYLLTDTKSVFGLLGFLCFYTLIGVAVWGYVIRNHEAQPTHGTSGADGFAILFVGTTLGLIAISVVGGTVLGVVTGDFALARVFTAAVIATIVTLSSGVIYLL